MKELRCEQCGNDTFKMRVSVKGWIETICTKCGAMEYFDVSWRGVSNWDEFMREANKKR